MKTIANRFTNLFLTALLLFLPLGSFLERLLAPRVENKAVLFWLIHWYEPVILLLFTTAAFCYLKTKQFRNYLAVAVCAIILFSFLNIFFFSQSYARGIEGLRFTFLPLLLVFALLAIPLEPSQKKKILSTYLYLGLAVAALGILERFFPLKYWELWGVLPASSNFGFGWYAASEHFDQSASILGAPNQFASYLLPVFFLALFKKENNLALKVIYPAIVLLAILFTSCRSAYVGLCAGIIIFIYFFNQNKLLKRGFSGFFSISILAFLYLFQTNLHFRLFATHGNQTGHQYAFFESVQELSFRLQNHLGEFIFGSGLGSAGPLAIKYGTGLISESWYLQLFLEVGLVGLLLWLAFTAILGAMLIRNQKALFLGLMSVSVAAVFLHTWADNPALTLTFFAILGVVCEDL